MTVPFELTLAVKERGRAQLDECRTSGAISGKVAAMASLSGCERGSCLGASNLLTAAGRVEGLEEEEGVERGEEEEGGEDKMATPWGEDFFFPFVGGTAA